MNSTYPSISLCTCTYRHYLQCKGTYGNIQLYSITHRGIVKHSVIEMTDARLFEYSKSMDAHGKIHIVDATVRLPMSGNLQRQSWVNSHDQVQQSLAELLTRPAPCTLQRAQNLKKQHGRFCVLTMHTLISSLCRHQFISSG